MSRQAFLTKLWLLLCCVAASYQSPLSITEFEVPQAVQAGEDVQLKCSYDLGEERPEALYIKWWLIPLHGDDRATLYQRIADQPGSVIRHNVELKVDEQDTIVLKNVTPADSGTYECEVSNIREERKHQELVVFTPGTGPQLNLSTVADGPDDDEEEDLLIECSASGVAPLPDFIVTLNGVEVNVTEYITGPDEDGLYEISGKTTFSKDDADGADIRCELIYLNPNITHQPYFDTELYSGGGSTTESPEDTTEMDSTPDSWQDAGDYGCQLQASWILLAVPVIARFTSLV